jgi:hypothetical protein
MVHRLQSGQVINECLLHRGEGPVSLERAVVCETCARLRYDTTTIEEWNNEAQSMWLAD